jgi:hypothetical protein
MPGEIEIEEWKCLAELIDNSFDDFNEIMISIILEAGRATMSILAVRQHRLRPGFNAFAISPFRHCCGRVPLLALLLSVELLNRALKRHRFQAATFHSSRILP